MKQLLLTATLLFAGFSVLFAQETLENFQWANGDKANLAAGWHGFTWGMSQKAVIAKMGSTDDASNRLLAYERKTGPFGFDGATKKTSITFLFTSGKLSAIWLPDLGRDFDEALAWYTEKFGDGTTTQNMVATNVI